jgi:hypothetical protein
LFASHFLILPGSLSLSPPKYNYDDYLHFIHGLDESETVKKRLLGVSREGREVWMVKISHPERPARKNLLAVARIHPYETSGSYCAEGILDAIRRPSAMAMDILARYNLYIVPMISPDGVFHGYGKLTTPGDRSVENPRHGRCILRSVEGPDRLDPAIGLRRISQLDVQGCRRDIFHELSPEPEIHPFDAFARGIREEMACDSAEEDPLDTRFRV